MSSSFKYLFTPLDLGPVQIRNRIFVTPHSTAFASDSRDNLPGERLAYYCAERAKGGVGLIEVSMGIISAEVGAIAGGGDAQFNPLSSGQPETLSGRWPIRALDPRVVDGYAKLANKVHEYGAKCFIELASGGSNVGNEKGVSPFPWPSHPIQALPFTAAEMDEQDIENEIESYGKAAAFVRDAGLDGVDLHGTHGVLISEFLSNVMNRRKDRWGGALENRMRFILEVVKRVREYTRDEIAVGMRLTGAERYENGNSPEVGAEIASRLDGKVDWITPDQGNTPQQEDWQAVPMYVESGYNLGITNPIKSVLKKTKLGVVGKYVDPVYAENLISTGLADMVAMTRALIADPELPNKTREGKIFEIRPCIGVLQDCWGRMERGLPISCTVNPVVSREREWGTVKLAETKKKVLIIGGGIAGLETARTAAERGHDVVIYEKSQNLGGNALLAAKLPGRDSIRSIVTWIEGQLQKHKVVIKRGMEVTPDPDVVHYILEEEHPDAIVIATGSSPIRTGFQPYTFNEIDGWKEPIVCTDVDIWENKVTIGKKAIVADSLSFIEAPGISEHLARKGCEVEIVTPLANIGLELHLINHWEHVFPRIFSLGVKISPFTWIKKIEARSAVLYNTFYPSSKRTVENLDNVVLITGSQQNNSLYPAFKQKAKQVYLIGDANIGGARIGNAMYDGQRVGREL